MHISCHSGCCTLAIVANSMTNQNLQNILLIPDAAEYQTEYLNLKEKIENRLSKFSLEISVRNETTSAYKLLIIIAEDIEKRNQCPMKLL